MKHDTRFEARLRNNLVRLWLAGVAVNTAILFWIGFEKLSTPTLLLIALGLASLNAVIGGAIYFALLALYKKGKSLH
jgi:apolipoprotein N-acyltransferase